jgi:hypothetical protein
MEIFATQTFMRKVDEFLGDLEFWALEEYVCDHPESGKLIPGGRGLRKLRWKLPNKGKRGGLRVIYYYRVGESILFVTAYRKSDSENLAPDELKALVALIEEE